MISKYKALVFDMDGTLIDSMRFWRQQNMLFLKKRGLPVPDEVKGREMELNDRQCGEIFIRVFGLQMTINEYLIECEQGMIDHYKAGEIPEKPGALAFLKAARAAGYKTHVATATPLGIATMALERQGMAQYLGSIMSTSSIGLKKNNPAFFERVSELIEVKASECLMFEDALYAMKAARQAGMDVYAIEEETSKHEKSEIIQLADRYFTNYDELKDELSLPNTDYS